MAEQRSEHRDDQGQHRKAGERAKTRWSPAANGGDGQHDRESFKPASTSEARNAAAMTGQMSAKPPVMRVL